MSVPQITSIATSNECNSTVDLPLPKFFDVIQIVRVCKKGDGSDVDVIELTTWDDISPPVVDGIGMLSIICNRGDEVKQYWYPSGKWERLEVIAKRIPIDER